MTAAVQFATLVLAVVAAVVACVIAVLHVVASHTDTEVDDEVLQVLEDDVQPLVEKAQEMLPAPTPDK